MAEKGILITDQAGGESVATRDAFEQDNDTNARVIQRIDFAVDHIVTPMGVALRTGLEYPDNKYITNFPAQLTDNLIVCGDKAKLVICVEFLDPGTTQEVKITPIMYDNEATPGVVSTMEMKTFSVSSDTIYRDSNPKQFLAVTQVWDLTGAYKIGLHATSIIGGTGCGGSQPACVGLSIWGFVI